MKVTRSFVALPIMILMALALVGCMETGKYNELIRVANKAAYESQNQDADVANKANVFDENLKDFPENRAALKSQADEIVGLVSKGITNLKSAADNFESASKLQVDDKLKDYATALAQANRKAVEFKEYFQKSFQLVDDPSITSPEEFYAKRAPLNQQLLKLKQEANDYGEKAKKIQTDNPSLFKKD